MLSTAEDGASASVVSSSGRERAQGGGCLLRACKCSQFLVPRLQIPLVCGNRKQVWGWAAGPGAAGEVWGTEPVPS